MRRQTPFLSLSADERAAIFEQTGQKTGRIARMIEKDFWVCWLLERLFTLESAPLMAFKGGTSLSKVFKVISRFSEDVDITIDKTSLGAQLHPSLSKTQARKVLDGLPRKVAQLAREILIPHLEHDRPEASVDYDETSMALTFRYPSVLPMPGDSYVTDMVLIEFGARNPIEPCESYWIEADAAPYFPGVSFPGAAVRVLSLARTFWEKGHIDPCRYQR